MKLIISWCLFSIISFALPAHYVSTTNVSVGDTLMYTVEVPSNLYIDIQPSLNGFEIIEKNIKRRSNSTFHEFQIQVFSIENLLIPTMSITNSNGFDQLDLKPIEFNLVSVLTADSNQLNDIEPIYNMIYINWTLLIILIVLISIAAIAVYAWRNKKNKSFDNIGILEEQSPLEIALKEINLLKVGLTNDAINLKLAYFKLTELFCEFLTSETNINVLDATTNEMKKVLKNSDKLSPESVKNIILISNEMDFFKFSKKPKYEIKHVDDIIKSMISLMKKVAK